MEGAQFRVVFTTTFLERRTGGGVTESSSRLSVELVGQGVACEFITTDYAGATSLGDMAWLIEKGVRVTLVNSARIPYCGLWAPRMERDLTRALVGGEGACLIHANGSWTQVDHVSAKVSRMMCCPLVISPRGTLMRWCLNHKAYKKWPAWFLYQRRDLASAAAIHATSHEEAQELRDLGISNPIAVVPNGVDIPSDFSRLPKRDREHMVLFLSRVHPKKGLTDLVRAWAKIKPSGWRVVIAGPDERGHRREIEELILECGLKGVFEFVGFVSGAERDRLFRQADLFVLPTRSENFGLVVAEAMSYALPVLTTKGAPWSELHTYNCGWWIDLGIDSLSCALSRAMQCSDQERAAMGVRGRDLIEKKYAWRAQASKMKALYEWLLSRGPRPDCVIID